MLTKGRIFLLWLPLAAMWFLMGAEQPAITSVIARFAQAKVQLAAFGVAFSFVVIFMSPTIQLLSTATALSTDRGNYRMLFRFSLILCAVMTLLLLLFGTTGLFSYTLIHLFRIPVEVVNPARQAYLVMTPFILFVGLRRLWQGVLVRYGRTSVVAIAMVTRVLTVALVLSGGLLFGRIEGAVIGALALTAGAFTAAVATYFSVRGVLRKQMPGVAQEAASTLSWRYLGSFYLPLALTGVVNLAAQPLFTFGIALSRDSLDSLAVWPVIYAFLMIFITVVFSYQDIVVALYRSNEDFGLFKTFTLRLGSISSSLFLLTALLPLSGIWYRYVAGLPPELLSLTKLPMIILSLTPAVAAFISWYRGVLIVGKTTGHIIRGAVIYLVTLAVSLFLGVRVFPVSGALMAAIAWTIGLFAEALYLHTRVYKETAP